jgi:hypothetical protein
VRFEAHVFDTVFAPLPGASVMLTVDDNPALKTVLAETRPGIHSGSLRAVPPGHHTFAAEATLDGRRYADAKGEFDVEPFSIEALDPNPDQETMARIASANGGIAVTAAGIDSVLALIAPKTVTEREERDSHPALSPILPALIILLLSAEWFLRKRRGMI